MLGKTQKFTDHVIPILNGLINETNILQTTVPTLLVQNSVNELGCCIMYIASKTDRLDVHFVGLYHKI